MFTQLTNFSYKRTTLQGFGFYIAYGVLIIIFAFIVGVLLSLGGFVGADEFDAGQRVGAFVAIISSLVLSYTVIRNRHLSGNFGFIILGLLSGVFAFFGGALLGLIPIAFLTTRN